MELPACPEVRACHSEGNPIGTVRRPEREKGRAVLSCKLDAPAPCRLNAPDLDFACHTSADCLHQHQQVI